MTAPPAGYSGTPLPAKLGIRPGSRVLVVGAPEGFLDARLSGLVGVTLHRRAGPTPYDVVLAFAPDRRRLRARFDPARRRLATAGGLWVAWPKRASGLAVDLDENAVRAHGLDAGLVDTKVCAIDETWSGLRFVRRLRDR